MRRSQEAASFSCRQVVHLFVFLSFGTSAFGSNPFLMSSSNANATGGGVGHPKERFYQKVIVTTVLEQPYMMLKQHSPYLAGNDRFEGYLADILMKLAASAGFQYEIRLARDGRQGELNAKHQWDGMIGELIAVEADVAAGAIIVTDEKSEYVDFTDAFLTLRSSAVIRKPKSKRKPHRIATVDQLLHSDLSFGVVDNSAAFRILSTSNDERNRALWGRIGRRPRGPAPGGVVGSVQEGIDRARRENYAFIVDSPMAEFAATRKPCDLYSTEPFLDVMRYAFAIRKGETRLRTMIDAELRKMKQSEEMQTMYLRWWRNECNELEAKGDESQELKRNAGDPKLASAVAGSSAAGLNLSRSSLCLVPTLLFLISRMAQLFEL